MRNKMNFGVIGLGYWGPNYMRILNELPDVSLKYCCDLDKRRLTYSKEFHNTTMTSSYHDILRDEEIDAVIITTPSNTHYKIVKDCLKSGKDVLVEKPLALNSKEGRELIILAEKKNKILMVGHTYLFNPGIIMLKSMVDSGEFGELLYGIAMRMGLGPIRKSASVLWDLATHDISILVYLFGCPSSVSCIGQSYIQNGIEDYASINLRYQNKLNFSIYSSWFCPEKIRKMTIVGKSRMVVFDDVNKSEMIKVFRRTLDNKLLNYNPKYIDHQNIIRYGATEIPYIPQSEPLKNQVMHFIGCIRTRAAPKSDGNHGLKVIRIAQAAEKSFKKNGRPIEVE